ncbi:hypothetical protein CK203_063451 [Vitis vinifera]|uniref:Uncharacterized protein n=1 Tax=Vitis vinifera TaxID=29760 RepID=A0A438FQV9_VITVI|nr:hypothetical protein CK203_063451 [Vitis vinifera]
MLVKMKLVSYLGSAAAKECSSKRAKRFVPVANPIPSSGISKHCLTLVVSDKSVNSHVHCSLFFPVFFFPGNAVGSKPLNEGSLTISGLQLNMLAIKKMSFFTDKKEVQRSATALGYVAHVCSFSLLNIRIVYYHTPTSTFLLVAVSLIASYLEVPLRYPFALGRLSFIYK